MEKPSIFLLPDFIFSVIHEAKFQLGNESERGFMASDGELGYKLADILLGITEKDKEYRLKQLADLYHCNPNQSEAQLKASAGLQNPLYQ